MTSRAAPILLALVLAATPASAQMIPVEGRWRVLIHAEDPGLASLRGELRLLDSAGSLRGTLRLESDSGPPLQLSRASRPAPDSLELDRIGQGALAFAGRWNGISWRGAVARGGRPLGRWEAVALAEAEEFYPAPPTFLLQQLILGSPSHGIEVPGSWYGAALARIGADPVATLAADHAEAARQAAAPVVPRERLTADGERWLLGLVDRDRWRVALAGDLARLGSRLDGGERARFDALFEPRAGWITDLHDAALRAARRRRPGAAWSDWAPALVASGLAPPGADAPSLMEAAWRLWTLGETDTAAFRLRLEAVRADDPAGGGIPLLLLAYAQAASWHLGATAFLAEQLDPTTEPGALALAPLGRPGASVAGALDTALAAALVRPANWEGEQWLARHGVAGLGRAIARLEPEYGEAASVDLGQGRFTLTTPAAEARAGHLGLAPLVRYDPGEAPLLAAVRVVMQRERSRMLAAWRAGQGTARTGTMALLPDPPPHLVAGLAESAADRSVAGLAFLPASLALRRALDAAGDPQSPAIVGHALLRVLAEALDPATPGDLRAEAVALGSDPHAVAGRAALARAWSAWRDAPPLVLPSARGPLLVPELRFTVEGGEPQVERMRVHALP
ncbi:MAG TPA: hypothetical protein VLA95_04845 [Gemmatimonadales bacterium]|nr:hypothetical protein [Gemmatimonadales bacterium]